MKRKYVLLVQGEGRGHITQCIAMHDALRAAGHTVNRVIIGKTPHRKLPAFVFERIKCPISTLSSPTFVLDKKNKGIRIGSSILKNVLKIKEINTSIQSIRKLLNEDKPHVIINFYDPLFSLLYFFKKPPFCVISVAHQNIFLHPEYQYPRGRYLDKMGLKLFTRFNSRKAHLRIALSLYPLPNYNDLRIKVTAPLLRNEVFEQEISNDSFILIYLVNPGYLEDIIEWCDSNPNTQVHCFSDRVSKKNQEQLAPNLTWHRINDKTFLEKMASCKGLVSTAGFETVAECMYFGKPALLVPVAGHYEQHCNANDAVFANVAIKDNDFNIDTLLKSIEEAKFNLRIDQDWIKNSAYQIIHLIEDEVNKHAHVPV